MIQRLAILGSTGSIGTSALEVVRHHRDRLEVVTLAAWGSDIDSLAAQAEEFRPALVAVGDETAAAELRRRLDESMAVVGGKRGVEEAATHPRVDRVVAAMVGAAGLEPAYAALAAGKDLALANKESLVVAGTLLTDLAAETGAKILPVDSEHVAIHQALRGGEAPEVGRLILTASGGPFRTRDLDTWDRIRPDEALRHPTWSMGAKISIDSATLMNKGLELIEASHLFAVPPEKIDVVIHPQSIIHSMVEYRDGSWLAQLAFNDMVLPIQYALSYPARWANDFPRLEIDRAMRLDFEPLDERRFPTIRLARRALAMGDSGPAVLNAANEEAVHAFLDGRVAFPVIVATCVEVLDRHRAAAISTLDEALEWDRWARREANELLAARSR
jgi:1-deoxy-D-xylulose-5-phosphate reductoisomerase